MNTNEINDTIIRNAMQQLIDEGTGAIREVVTAIFNRAMVIEREQHLNAGAYERADARDGYANGFKPKRIITQDGTLELAIPQVRASSRPFYPKSLEKGKRCDRAVAAAAAEMYIKGVSTRKVEEVFSCLGIEGFSAEQVSNATKDLDEQLEKWRNRELGEYKVIFCDATYQKVRKDGVAMDYATFIITGIAADGHRAIIAVDSDFSEAEVHWRRVLRSLVDRGLRGLKLIVSDAHEGLANARKACFSGVLWQRCQMHLQQNAQHYVTKISRKSEVASDIRAIFNAPSLEEAQRLLKIFLDKYTKDMPNLAAWAEENLPQGFTVFSLPEAMRKKLRTNNIAERLNAAIKSRTRIITVFPSQASQLRLVTAICSEQSEDWESGSIYLNVEAL